MSAMWYVFWHGPATGAAILASVGAGLVLVSWFVSPLIRFCLRRIGIWLITFGAIFLVMVLAFIMLPGPVDNPENGVGLDVCIFLALAFTIGLLEGAIPGFHGDDPYATTHY